MGPIEVDTEGRRQKPISLDLKPISPLTHEFPLWQEPPCSRTLTAGLPDLSAAGSRDAEIECAAYNFMPCKKDVHDCAHQNHLLFKSMGEALAIIY